MCRSPVDKVTDEVDARPGNPPGSTGRKLSLQHLQKVKKVFCQKEMNQSSQLYYLQDLSWEDMLIAYSTLPGYVSYRDVFRGTWFIESICKVTLA